NLGVRRNPMYLHPPVKHFCFAPLGLLLALLFFAIPCLAATPEPFADLNKPVLHGRHWVAITGKPLGATAGARMFERGGNAIDAACAMLAGLCTVHAAA